MDFIRSYQWRDQLVSFTSLTAPSLFSAGKCCSAGLICPEVDSSVGLVSLGVWFDAICCNEVISVGLVVICRLLEVDAAFIAAALTSNICWLSEIIALQFVP